jgi:hypothetical protein
MVTLKLKVSFLNRHDDDRSGSFMSVTSDQLEVVPSPGGVSLLPSPCVTPLGWTY